MLHASCQRLTVVIEHDGAFHNMIQVLQAVLIFKIITLLQMGIHITLSSIMRSVDTEQTRLMQMGITGSLRSPMFCKVYWHTCHGKIAVRNMMHMFLQLCIHDMLRICLLSGVYAVCCQSVDMHDTLSSLLSYKTE